MGGTSSQEQLQNQVFELRFAVKQLERASKKCEALEKKERKKLAEAMKTGNQEIARLRAENAIRHKTQALNYLRLSARMDAVAVRLQNAGNITALGKQMQSVNRVINGAIKTMDFEKSTMTMEQFEKQCQDLDVALVSMEKGLEISAATVTPHDDVEHLMREVADENNIEFQSDLEQLGTLKKEGKVKEDAVVETEEESLQRRLKELSEL